jgi:azurin
MVSHISRRGFLKSLALAGGAVAGGALLSACGGGAATPAAPAAAPVTLEIGSKGDELAYDKTTLEAPAGSKITLKLKNNASEASGNKHNWVLTKTADADAVAIDGIAAGEANSYEKPGDARIIAAIKLIPPGQTGEVTFDAPPAGAYTYICTFPGHNVNMKGTLTIK